MEMLPKRMTHRATRRNQTETEIMNEEHVTKTMEQLKSLRYRSYSMEKPWLDAEGNLIWSRNRMTAARIAFSQSFETCMGIIILANLVLIVYEANEGAKCFPNYFKNIKDCPYTSDSNLWLYMSNVILLLIFSVECLFRAYVERGSYLWNKWNLIDLFTVLSGWVGLAASNAGIPVTLLRMFRLVRVVRALRFLISVPEFYLLITGLYSSIKAIVFGALMLVSVITFWAVISVEVLHPITSGMTWLCWRNKEKKEFRVSWKHAGKPDFVVEKDAMLFKLWAEHTGKYRPGESADPSTWKTRFRCALHKMPDVEEVKVPHSLDEKEPYRVFRFKDKDDCSQKPQNFGSLRSEENQNGKRPMCRVKGDSVIRSTAPSAKAENVFFNNYPILSGPLNCGRLQDSPHNSSDSSPEDDLDSITPTIPPYPSQGYEPMLTDEPICGNLPNPYQFSYSNSHLLFGGDSASDNFIRPTQLPPRLESLDFTNVRKDILEATLVTNGQMFNGLSESGQAFLQHLMATNPALMKLWRQGAFSPNESSNGSSSVSTHFNMDNGLIEATGLEMDESMGRTVTNIHQSNENPGSGFARPGKQAGDSCESAMRIRVFYGNYEVLSTDTKQTESERLIRISHGCHMVEPRKLELGLLCQLFGPPTARQIELPPAVNNNSREVMKVMDFIKRGIILEINESNDIIVTRLCLARVYYSNGRKAAKKLIREERTKVFDYQGKFLPNLRESQNGNCEYPSYEVTLYLGRADGSLVSIVITHVMAKMTLHITSSSGENFWSEPNANDQLATNLEEDCMY